MGVRVQQVQKVVGCCTVNDVECTVHDCAALLKLLLYSASVNVVLCWHLQAPPGAAPDVADQVMQACRVHCRLCWSCMRSWQNRLLC